ncbi:beta-glucosidase [Phyllosticta citrichinensis]|uniref:beta-glucosidase n=1 Tax=Phyllosticta citrichinensis TaxID=1130410 RepID=A0ABR1Y8M6_9PEZI
MAPLDVDKVLAELDLNEKISLLSGIDFWHTAPVKRLGIPSIRTSDGPNGVRGTQFFNGVPAACFPCGTGLAATWDQSLIKDGGRLMGREAIAKGAHVILGPTVNMQRSPLGGRGFESFSEDPYLAGAMGAAVVGGIQDTGVAATIKHFVCNDQEHERQAMDAVLSQRALREIYLMPFQIAQRDAKPMAYMTAYNRVNGTHMSDNKRILQEILRDEWGFDGLVMSDWFGTYTSADSINAGLDLEMPGPPRVRGNQTAIDVGLRKIQERTIDERVRKLLELINKVDKLNIPENAPESTVDSKETSEALRYIGASSHVLLKNEGQVLPFKRDRSVAVIGPNAQIACYAGGGSASLRPYYAVTPFEGIKAQGEGDVKYALGAAGHRRLPDLGRTVKTADGSKSGLTAKFFIDPPSAKERKQVDTVHVETSDILLADYKNPEITSPYFWVDLEGKLTPDESREWLFGVSVSGTANLWIGGKLVVDNTENQKQGDSFFGSGTIEEFGSIYLEAGKTYDVLVQFGSSATSNLRPTGTTVMAGGGVRVGGTIKTEAQEEIDKAVTLAKEVDQVVVIAGLSADWESEGYDRKNMDLPGASNELIAAIAAANPKTAVFLQSGTPVSMPWISSVPAIVQAWYGGNETGNAVADVLFGKVSPSGKLPLSFPVKNEDNPAFLNYRSERGRTLYGEDVYVGYRYYEKVQREVLFPFGWGLSYTTFDLSNLRVEDESTDGKLVARVDVKNTGPKRGAQVVQVYVSQGTPSIGRPKKELKGFTKVWLEPGEQSEARVELDKKYATSFWDEEAEAWISEADEYEILVGDSSVSTPLKARFGVAKTTWWKGL